MNAVQPLHPASGLVQVNAKGFCVSLAHLDVGGLAVGMVCLVVDDHQVLVSGQLAQHPPGESLVALFALLHHRTVLILQRHQGVPVFDQDVGPIQLLAHCLRRAQFKLVVVVLRVAWQQHLQPRLHSQARSHQENGTRIFAG